MPSVREALDLLLEEVLSRGYGDPKYLGWIKPLAFVRAAIEEDDSMARKEAAFTALDSLIKRARVEKKWLYCTYPVFWITPDELAAGVADGKYRIPARRWELRDPNERLVELRKVSHAALSAEYATLKKIQALGVKLLDSAPAFSQV